MRPSLSIIAVACAATLSVHAQFKAQGYETPSYIEFSSSRFEVTGTETNAVVTIVRNGDFRKSAAVDYSTVDGTAEGNVNFRPCGGTITFASGQSIRTINIPILRDEPAPTAWFKVELTAATAETVVVTPTAEVQIKSPPPPLAILAAGTNITISWPDLGEPFALEALIENAWNSVGNPPTLENGDWTVKLSPTAQAPMALFRLQLQSGN